MSTATYDTIAAEAQNLAAAGYIITAVGAGNENAQGVPASGFVLIGTRVQGDTLPRPLKVLSSGDRKAELWDQGYAIVGYVVNPAGFVATWIGEK